jgi:hypothetical protein
MVPARIGAQLKPRNKSDRNVFGVYYFFGGGHFDNPHPFFLHPYPAKEN